MFPFWNVETSIASSKRRGMRGTPSRGGAGDEAIAVALWGAGATVGSVPLGWAAHPRSPNSTAAPVSPTPLANMIFLTCILAGGDCHPKAGPVHPPVTVEQPLAVRA